MIRSLSALAVAALTLVAAPAVAANNLTPYYTAKGGTSPRFSSDRAADVRTPQDFSTGGYLPGSGGDDSAAINAAITALAATYAGGTLRLPPPSSGFYNICASTISLPTGSGAITIAGDAGITPQYSTATQGGSVIRVLPGCASPPASVFTEGTGASYGGQITLRNFTIDGYCLAEDLVVNSGHGLISEDMVYRNSIGGTGYQNVYFGPTVGSVVWTGGRTENINDAAHSCYTTTASLPDYDINFQGHDSVFANTQFIDANISNYEQGDNADNVIHDVHDWNHAGIAGSYSFESSGPMRLYHWTGDTFTAAAVHLKVGAYTNNSEVSENYLYNGTVFTSSTIGVLIDSGVQYAYIHDNNFCTIANVAGNSAANGVVQSGTASSTTFVYNNACASYSTAYPSAPASLNVGVSALTDQLQINPQAVGSGTILQAYSTGANSPLFLASQGASSVTLKSDGKAVAQFYNLSTTSVNYFKFQGTASGSYPILAVGGTDSTIGANVVTVNNGPLQVNGAAVLTSGGALGTPSSATLSNATGYPVTALTGGGLAGAGALGYAYSLCQGNAAGSPVTGTTSETNVASCTIPAGAIGANGSLEIDEIWSFSGTAGTKNAVTRLSTASGGTTGTAYLNFPDSAANTNEDCQFSIYNQNSASAQVGRSNGLCSYGPNSGTLSTSSINTGATSYINFNITLANAADSATLQAYKVTLTPAGGM